MAFVKKKRLIITSNTLIRKEDIEEIRKDMARQLQEGILILDGRFSDVIVIEDMLDIEVKGGDSK